MRALLEPKFIVTTIASAVASAFTVGVLWSRMGNDIDQLKAAKVAEHLRLEQRMDQKVENLKDRLDDIKADLKEIRERLNGR